MIDVEFGALAARVTLVNPEKRNAMGDEFIAELTRILADIAARDTVRAMVLAAEGPAFCAGGDLNWMARAAHYDRAENIADARALGDMLRRLNELPVPVIARVQGPAYGGGVGLLCCCDIVLAVPTAQFALSETRLGLVPGVISPFVVAALGPRQARRYALTGERFGAPTAQAIGLVHEIVEEDALDAAIDALVGQIAQGGPRAVAASKALMRRVAWAPVDEAVMRATAQAIADVRAGDEGREGVAAFLEKRRPAWVTRGRGEAEE